jgi:hypothetical protein
MEATFKDISKKNSEGGGSSIELDRSLRAAYALLARLLAPLLP